MTESFEELEDHYRATLNRMSTAYQMLRDVMGEPRPLAPGEEPPVLTEAHRNAQTEAMRAFQDYVPARDLSWATWWGREGNPPKS